MAPQREWFDTDYYKVLGVPSDAPEKEITRSYRKLAKQFHPDANPGSEDKFKQISSAYDVLGDPERRKEYDEVRRLGPMAGGFGGPNAGGGNGSTFNFRIDDLGDLFGGIFNRGSRGRGGPGTAGTGGYSGYAGPRRGADVEAELHLSFEEAVDGVVASVNVVSADVCHTCGGSGARPGSTPITCPRCSGTGTLNDDQGLFSLAQPCPECRGRGIKVTDPCPTCMGTGAESVQRQVKVRIPTGVEDGQRIRVKGRGEPGANGAPAGDLFVTVHSADHPLFGRRKPNHLTVRVPITWPEAVLGADIKVPSLTDTVTVRIPPGTPSGKTFRVRGRGVAPSGNGKPGDLLVTVEIDVPHELDDEQRKAVEAFAEATTQSPREHLGA